ncbi:MAG: Hsp33 family molecular chaperone HslO [Thiotrichales bacterium]
MSPVYGNQRSFVPFLFENKNIRGELVQLDQTWQEILSRSEYPDSVKQLLGESVAAAALLLATLKVEGSLTLQVRGEGPLHLMVVHANSDRSLRGLARWSGEVPEGRALSEVFGVGYLVITIDPAEGERYQGIVPLTGTHIQDALKYYFDQSEQLPTRLWLQASDNAAAGLLLQVLPGEQSDEDAWNRVSQLADTVTADELLGLEARELLHRLFHEETVRLFEPEPLRFACSCSTEKIIATLRQLGEAEVRDILETEGQVEVTCDFCNQSYRFDSVDITAVFQSLGYPEGSSSVQ